MSRKLAFAVYGSLFLSLVMIAWAFTIPFRNQDEVQLLSGDDVTQTSGGHIEAEATMSTEEYLQYMRERDAELLERVREKYRPKHPIPNERESNEQWRAGIEKEMKRFRQSLKRYEGEQAEGEVIIEGTVEWDRNRSIKRVLEDAPRGVEF